MKIVLTFPLYAVVVHQELYTWDKGNQLTYPTRYHEIGNNVTSNEKTDDLNPQMQMGFEVYRDNGYD